MALEDLKAAAISAARALSQAAEWLGEPANQERVGTVRKKLDRDIRRLAVSADKLAAAAERSMCVSVFGPSQVGKSHLVSVLAAPKGGDLMAVFEGHGDTSYIRKINPDKGKEATGLVTRFTTQMIASPANFPVCLRLLSHADILKILCNAYYRDGSPNKYEHDELPDMDALAAHLAKYEALATGRHDNGLRMEDIWDLQEYCQSELGEFHYYKNIDGPFWNAALKLVSRLDPASLAGFFAILWNRHEAITALYLKLFDALRALSFSSDAFCRLEAITEETRIIDVDALNSLVIDQGELLLVAPTSGLPAQMTRAVLAALTAELRIVMRERAWDFLAHTDILDFPGYRARGLSGLEEEHDGRKGLAGMFVHNRAGTLKDLFLRGKVDYLFQRYVAEQEITAMMLCIKESNMEVVSLPEVVNDWIARTHGGPKDVDRVNQPVLMFFILTRFDLMLKAKANDRDANPVDNFEGRMQASLVEKFAKGHSWPNAWTPGQPFRNTYLMRSPGAKSELFTFQDDYEIALRPEEEGRVLTLRGAFASAPLVQKHFVDPTRAFDEMLRVGDGGTSYIVENLSKVCLADTKLKQIKARLRQIASRVHESLNRFYISTDVDTRLLKSEAEAQTAIDAVEQLLVSRKFGSFLRFLMVEGGALSNYLQQAIVNGALAAETPASAAESFPRPAGLPRPGLLPRPGAPAAAAAPEIPRPESQVATRDLELARSAVEFWTSSMDAALKSEAVRLFLGLDEAVMRSIVAELAAAATRIGLPMLIARELGELSHVELFDQHVAKACLIAEQRINHFVAQASYSYADEAARPVTADGEMKVFAARPAKFSAEGLPDQASDTAQRFTIDWIYAYFEMVRANAMSESGQTFDIEQNRRLGSILQTLEAVQS